MSRRTLSVVSILALAACGAETTLPTVGVPSLGRSANHANVAPFVAAQGTWCDRTIPGDCDYLDALGIGWINAFWDGTAPIGTGDPGGVNARWYALNRQPGWPVVPPYAATGIVQDDLMPDGRRHLRVKLRVENTFLAFYDDAFNIVLGATFDEYGTIPPVVASMDFDYEAYLPAGFVGMPDLVQYEAWDHVVRWDATLRASGVLRGDLRGVPAGTAVDVVWRTREVPRGDGRSAKPNYGYMLSLKDAGASLSVTRR